VSYKDLLLSLASYPDDSLGRYHMASIATANHQKCPRCGSRLVSLEWDERVNPREVQDLWQCWRCNNKFITTVPSEEREPSVAEITAPFFTSLVME